MKIIIIDCGSGNLRSVQKAFEKVSASLYKNCEVIISSQTEDLDNANYIILPGVGTFSDFVKGLRSIIGMEEALNYLVIKKGIPFLGICVGMQVLATKGFENIETKGLNWIGGSVMKIKAKSNLPLPQMGWNNLMIHQQHAVVKNINDGDHTYFANSYAFHCDENSKVIASVDYGVSIPVIIAKENIIGMQFHPEKSQQIGLNLISNFLS